MTQPQVNLVVSDRSIATVVAYEAARTPGVARLQPHAVEAVRGSVTHAAKRAAAVLSRRPDGRAAAPALTVDTAAVDIARTAGVDVLTVTIRIIATTTPAVLQVANDLAERISARLLDLVEVRAEIVVHVLGIDT